MQKNKPGRIVPDIFLFPKKVLFKVRASGLQLSFDYFDKSKLGIQQKQTVQNFRLLIQRYAQF